MVILDKIWSHEGVISPAGQAKVLIMFLKLRSLAKERVPHGRDNLVRGPRILTMGARGRWLGARGRPRSRGQNNVSKKGNS